jgi:hypothetical protein
MTTFMFLDESGEYTYHAKSPRYLVYVGVATDFPTLFTLDLADLKYRLLRQGQCIEYFHASEDEQAVRDAVFRVITSSDKFAIHSIIVRKNRVNASLRKFGVYSIAYRTMLKYLVGRGGVQRLHIIVDTPPDKKQQTALKETLKAKADQVLRSKGIVYTIDHHRSSSHALLQVADYCAWAIQKKWQSSDARSYDLIRNKSANEFDIYASGDMDYY